jgi:DNA topoisomerase-3
MPKTLIIAEKPSVATDLARVLAKVPGVGKFEKHKDHFESDTTMITSAVGHLVELKMPSGPNGKKLPWGFKHLPCIPDSFELQPIEKSEPRLKAVVRLMKSKDVGEIINACDAGREGELIFQYLLMVSGVKKPVKRLWMQSMTNQSILDAYKRLRTDREMQPLADAALCRSESDWLVGLNGTRALTAYNSRNGGFNVTTAGRVQTPTLVILAEREIEIRAFISEDYYEVHGDFDVTAGSYAGRWFREDFKKDPDNIQLRPERIWKGEEAEAIRDRCEGKIGIVEETKKPSKQATPQLYDLTTLQREAGNRFGYSARRTLQLAQALYERYKVLTYPRTDSRYLPEDYVETVKETLGKLKAGKPSGGYAAELPGFASHVLANNMVVPSKRLFDNAKVSDHFAIIPTGEIPTGSLDADAAKLFDLVTRRFLAVFYPAAEFELTSRITRIGADAFKTDGRVLIVPGWLEVYGRKPGVAASKDELVGVKSGEEAQNTRIEVRQDATKPPARYTEATLLSAMETAGKRVDDDELREAMSERGLGTPATRAAIIEGLIAHKYIFRDERAKRDLVVSNKGLELVQLLKEVGITALGSPEMTGEWEHKLKEMEHGRLDRETFMSEIKDMTRRIVDETKRFADAAVNRVFPDLLAPCPKCQAPKLKQTDATFQCYDPDCGFRMSKSIASHELSLAQAAELLTKKFIGPFDTFKSRFGKPFTAGLELGDDFKVSFVFEKDEDREDERANLSDEQVICEVPGAKGQPVKVYETEKAFLAPDLVTKAEPRGVRVGKTILQRAIPADQAKKLFLEGKTDLLPGFVSKKGRKFAAHLTMDRETGKVGFEFAPREAKKKVAKKKSAKKTGEE